MRGSRFFFLVLLAGLGLAFAGCSCRSRPERPDLLSLTGGGGEDELRRQSGLRAGEFRRDIRFRGKWEESPEMEELKDDGRRALKNEDFRQAMAALKKDDYDEARGLLQRAEGYLPDNQYLQRWRRRVEMYELEHQGRQRPELKQAGQSMLEGEEPSVVLQSLENLKADPNPFVRRKVHYYRMHALEAAGREDEAAEARGAWLQARDEIGAIDASSRTPSVQPE